MQRTLARRFIGMCAGTLLLALLCVSYIYAIPSNLTITTLEQDEEEQLAVASQPSRLAFISFNEDSTIRAFWKSPEDSTHRLTIVIDPNEQVDEEETSATDRADEEQPDEAGTASQ